MIETKIQPVESFGKHELAVRVEGIWVHLYTGYLCEVQRMEETIHSAQCSEIMHRGRRATNLSATELVMHHTSVACIDGCYYLDLHLRDAKTRQNKVMEFCQWRNSGDPFIQR